MLGWGPSVELFRRAAGQRLEVLRFLGCKSVWAFKGFGVQQGSAFRGGHWNFDPGRAREVGLRVWGLGVYGIFWSSSKWWREGMGRHGCSVRRVK